MESVNPYQPPAEADGDAVPGSSLVDSVAFDAARLGLRLVYLSIVCGLVSIIGGVGLSILTSFVPFGALAIVPPLLFFLGTMAACALMFAGQIMSCRVPAMTGARGHAIASALMTGGALVCFTITVGLGLLGQSQFAARADQAFGVQMVAGGASLLMMAFFAGAIVTYVLFLRALASHLNQPAMEQRAHGTLRMMFVALGLWLAFIAFAVAVPFFGGGEVMLLSTLGMIGFLVLILVRVSNLVLQLRRVMEPSRIN